jgi:flagellar motility protein MotE (MotC chaperone)
MASAIRVLPALIAVSIGALAFKGADLAQAVAEATDEPKAQAAEPETALTAAVDGGEAAEGAPPTEGALDAADKCMPSLDYTSETGISEQEIQVLRSLADRRKSLDEREATVETREQMAAAAEQRLNDQIAELKKLEADVDQQLAAMDVKRDERMTALVKTYEAMKPKDAASIFNAMDDKVMIDLAKSMKPATLAAVMASMETKRAEALTRMLASLAATPPPVAAPQKTTG